MCQSFVADLYSIKYNLYVRSTSFIFSAISTQVVFVFHNLTEWIYRSGVLEQQRIASLVIVTSCVSRGILTKQQQQQHINSLKHTATWSDSPFLVHMSQMFKTVWLHILYSFTLFWSNLVYYDHRVNALQMCRIRNLTHRRSTWGVHLIKQYATPP